MPRLNFRLVQNSWSLADSPLQTVERLQLSEHLPELVPAIFTGGARSETQKGLKSPFQPEEFA